MAINFNLNDMATVTLTQVGADIYNAYDREMEGHSWWEPKNMKAGSVLRTSVWQLFKIFGLHIQMSMPEVPFLDNEITLK